MNVQISYKNLEASPSIEAKINDKLEHLKIYFDNKMNVNWVCSVDGHQQHKSEVNIVAGHHNFHAQSVDRDLYKSLDQVIHKIESQIRKENDKKKEKPHYRIREEI